MSERQRLARRSVAALAAILILALSAPVAAADTAEFPPGYTEYHTHAEMVAEIDAAVTAHPGIVSKFSIGQSYEGRDIWAVKISDHVGRDEKEPEVLFEGLHHASEHMAVEMNLYMMSVLISNYGGSSALGQRVTQIVNSREIFIVFMMNPDGAEWDISAGTGRLRDWRRNRQPIPGTTTIGVDLNRNWGYQWGCCGGSSGKPGTWNYRGPEPWFAPEVRALRDFVLSRVVNGRQQIRAAMSIHIYERSIMWPYGYTRADLPRTMTGADHDAFVAIGHGIAALNGYTPKQLSDLYLQDGDAPDWLYGNQRIFAMLIEMYPTSDPKGADIAGEVALNRDAMLYFIEQADCPYRAAGTQALNCGPLYDDFEAGRGWAVNPHGTDTATSGKWERGTAEKTSTSAGVKQQPLVPSGQAAIFTGRLAGGGVAANDVDGGTTSVRSPRFKLGAAGSHGWTLSFSYAFAHNATASSADYFSISVDGQATPLFVQTGIAGNRNAVWTSAEVDLDPYAGQTIRLLVKAGDQGADSVVEAAIDDVRVYKAP
jgi:carboxypeptidase T